MDGRGRLAQPLKPKSGRRAASIARRWQRQARRWLGPLNNINPPRGAGIAAATILIGASLGYGISKGGHAQAIAAQVKTFSDKAANRAGFGINSIELSGNKQINREEILMLAGVTGGSSLLFLDAAAARKQLKTNPWISDATVLKLYPGELRIEITEREAFALWQLDGDVSVIAADGTVLEPYVSERFKALPQVVGRGAEHEARDFLKLIAGYRELRELVDAAVLVAERRWNLRLRNGIEVRLPASNIEQALATLIKLDRGKKLLARDIVVVDLRVPDRVTVRLTDAAAQERQQAREDAIKASAEKDRKPKRKGDDA